MASEQVYPVFSQLSSIQGRADLSENGYCKILAWYLPESLLSLIVDYADLHYCSIHKTYFPSRWRCCMLCAHEDPNEIFVLSERGHILNTDSGYFLQLTTADDIVHTHILTIMRKKPIFFRVGFIPHMLHMGILYATNKQFSRTIGISHLSVCELCAYQC